MPNHPELPPREYTESVSRPESQQATTKVPLPQSFQSLPTTEISKLSESLGVLKGYLVSLIQEDLHKNVQVLNSIIKDLESFLKELGHLERSKQDTDRKLANYQSLLHAWEQTEQRMYHSLSRFNSQAIAKALNASIIDSKKLSTSLQQSFINHTEPHDDQSIQNFIQLYQAEQKSYHLKQEKLRRLHENRVNGLYI